MLRRFSISLEEDLLDKFDQYILARQYNNRSEAVRDLIEQTWSRRSGRQIKWLWEL